MVRQDSGRGRNFFLLDILTKIGQGVRMKMMQAQQPRYVDDPEGLLCKAILEQAVVDLVQPNQYVDEEARVTARRLISSCVLDELIETSNMNLCANVVRQKLKIPRDRTSDYYFGERKMIDEN